MKKIRSYGHLSVYSPDNEYVGFSFRADFAAMMAMRLGHGATIRIAKGSGTRILYVIGEHALCSETEDTIMQCIDDRIWEIKVEPSKYGHIRHVRNLAERFKSDNNGKSLFDERTYHSIISAEMCDQIWNEVTGGVQ